MAPHVPYHVSAGQTKTVKFGGILTTEFLEPPPGRSFLFRQTYKHTLDTTTPLPAALRRILDGPDKPKGPPRHFHPFQTEWCRVEKGVMGLHLDGKEYVYTPEDGEQVIPRGSLHNFYIHPTSPESMTVCFSASDAGIDYQLDRIWFENWYGYWHDAMLYEGGKMDIFQYHAIWDGGDAYPPVWEWIPFAKQLGYWKTVILGRWIGGLLGYKPFFREYTTDWDFAVAKMKGSFFQRHLVQEAYKADKGWDGVQAMETERVESATKYEMLTKDLSTVPLELGPPKFVKGKWVGDDEEEMAKLANGYDSGVDLTNGVVERRRVGVEAAVKPV